MDHVVANGAKVAPMELDLAACQERLRLADHGVLATVHPDRGVDAVPVVFALDGAGRVLVPVDTVKAKRTTRLQRLVNLEHDPRCVLLVEHYEEDWSKLWWVRVHGRASEIEATPDVLALLAARHEQYRAPGAVSGALMLSPAQITGWAAG